MKKIIISFSLLLSVGVSSAFANYDPSPDEQVLNVFKREFAAAQNVSWSEQGDYLKANFILAGHRVAAWFSEEGELQGCIRDIFFDQLPLGVMTAVDKKFPDAEISEVREITNSEGTSYKVFLTAKEKRYSLKVSSAGTVDSVEKLTK